MHQYEDFNIKKSKERLITAIENSTDNMMISRKTRKQKWDEKQYGYFKRQTDEISHEKTCTWLRKRKLKRETDFLKRHKTTRYKLYYSEYL